MVPYSQISFSDQQMICYYYEKGQDASEICERNPSIDENNVKAVLRNCRSHWREKLRALKICLFPSDDLIQSCFRIIRHSSCRYTGGSTNFFPLPHSFTRQRPGVFYNKEKQQGGLNYGTGKESGNRSDCGVSRKIDDDRKEQITYLKHHYSRMSAAAIYQQLQDNGSIRSGQLSESTICRFINQLTLQERLTKLSAECPPILSL